MKTSLPTRCITAGILVLLLAVSITTGQRVASAQSVHPITKPVKKTQRVRVTPKPAHLPPPHRHKETNTKSQVVKRASADASFSETLTISLTPPDTSTTATRGLVNTAFDTAVCVSSSDDGAAVGEDVTVSLASGATTTVTMGSNGCGTATLTPLADDAGTATITASVSGETGAFASDSEEVGEYGPASATATVTVASLDCGDSILLTPGDITTIVNDAQASGLFTDDELSQISANACLVSHPVLSPITLAVAGDTSGADADVIDGSGGNGDITAANASDGDYDGRVNFNWPLALQDDLELKFGGFGVKTVAKKGFVVASVAVGLEYKTKHVNGQWDGNVYNVSILSLKRQEVSLKGFQENFSWTGPTVVNGAGKGVYEFATDGQSHSDYGKTWRMQLDATLGLKFSAGVGPISASADATIDKLNGAEVIVYGAQGGQTRAITFRPDARVESFTETKIPQNA